MKFDIGKINRRGHRKTNQDRIGFVESKHAILMVVADGMGGHEGGELAAEVMVTCAIRQFNDTAQPLEDPKAFLHNVIQRAHREISILATGNNPPLKARTTCVLCIIQDGFAYWAHVGDSRLYVIRYGRVVSHTVDHSKVEELFQQGHITAQQKANHPERHLVTQCVGSVTVRPQPAYSAPLALQRGDIVLLCSDGFWGPLSEQQIGHLLNSGTLTEVIEQLALLAENTSAPYADNISAVALRWLSSAPLVSQPAAAQQVPTLNQPINTAAPPVLDKIVKKGVS